MTLYFGKPTRRHARQVRGTPKRHPLFSFPPNVRRAEFMTRGPGFRPAGARGWLKERFDFSRYWPPAPASRLQYMKGLA